MDIYSLLALLVVALLVIIVCWLFVRYGYKSLRLGVKLKDIIVIDVNAKK